MSSAIDTRFYAGLRSEASCSLDGLEGFMRPVEEGAGVACPRAPDSTWLSAFLALGGSVYAAAKRHSVALSRRSQVEVQVGPGIARCNDHLWQIQTTRTAPLQAP